MKVPRTSASVLLVGVVVAGCSAGEVDKGGGSGGVLTLSLASPEQPGRPGSRDVEYFAEQVSSGSEGRVRVDVEWGVGDGGASWDQVAAQQVIEGTSDLGFIPARSWDTLGVTTLQALQAPFLVTSDSALDAVVSDPVAEEMLSGLDELGVSGLGLFPEGLRHPASFAEPLLEPADFAGVGIRTPLSDLSWETLQALGATPLDIGGEEMQTLFREGRLGGAETSAAYVSSLPWRGVLTGNLTPYAKANVLVANTEALEALTDEQRELLLTAADDTLEHSIETRPSDADELAAVCAEGLEVVVATAEQQAAMAAATQPVRDRLAADESTGPLLARITEIVASSEPPSAGTTCADATPVASSPDDLGRYDGVWRYEVTYQDGLDAGLSETEAAEELGVQTVTLDGGSSRWEWRSRRGEQVCEGTYSLDDGVLQFVEEPQCGGRWEARPALDGAEISWTDVRSRVTNDPADQLVRELLHSVPWRKIEEIQAARPLPEGVYRWEMTEDQLIAAGVDPRDAFYNGGLSTFTVEDGTWVHHVDGRADPTDCGGTYEVRGSRIAFITGPPLCPVEELVFMGRWEPTADGIRFTAIQPSILFNETYWGLPWRRIS
ncbi:TRAP transporter substrate-binding protein DctP [Blastococcus sp. CT_GayMR20]|uniref:TRAP transporter substrate-binding protein n=1 Tax=Blastococcus sp. CT_GayMR20 TaxID=2559609 RepID=UPI001430553D|nr:TRAP transporter substrate-binding protein DctP [Blastococcus sp. CT_GayMR20]